MKETQSIYKLPNGYIEWRKRIEYLIENSKLRTALQVNSDLLSLYWHIGTDILSKKKELGWGAQVVQQLSRDLSRKFPGDKGYSVRNLHYMRQFAENYPDFPILQVPLAEFKELPISKQALAELAHGKEYVDISLLHLCRG